MWSTTMGPFDGYIDVLRKIFQTCVSMSFPYFERQMVWRQVFCKNVSESFFIENCDSILPMVS